MAYKPRTMWFMYLVPIFAIVGVLVYTTIARRRIASAVAGGQGPELFHQGYAGYFSSLAGEERIVGVWPGLAYTGSSSEAGRLAGALANYAAANTIGVSKYTPNVYVAVTSRGRVLIAEEYSELGDRGNYREVLTLAPGATAVTGAAAVPGHQGNAPKNPFDPRTPLELTTLTGPGEQHYSAWLSAHGLEVASQQRSIAAVLPIDEGTASALWQAAQQPAPAA